MDPRPSKPPDVVESGPATRTRTVVIAVVLMLVVAAVVVLVLTRGDPDRATEPAAGPTVGSPATLGGTTPGTSPGTPSTTRSSGPDLTAAEAATVVWPAPGGPVTYDDPVAAARGMATGLVGFSEPLTVSTFRAGDTRSGEVDLRIKPAAMVTTVLVRQMSDGHWYTIGASTADLQLGSPAAGAQVTPPVTVTGQARAFEGVFLAAVHAQGTQAPLGETLSQGSGGPDLGAFTSRITFTAPASSGAGAIVLSSISAEDGRVQQATVVPVRLAQP